MSKQKAKQLAKKILKDQGPMHFEVLIEKVKEKSGSVIHKDSFLYDIFDDASFSLEGDNVSFKETLSVKEFTLKAINALKEKSTNKGIHAVYSGFNAAFREYFPGLNPVEEVNKLEKEGVVHVVPCKGGVFINPGPKSKQNGQKKSLSKDELKHQALEKMGLS